MIKAYIAIAFFLVVVSAVDEKKASTFQLSSLFSKLFTKQEEGDVIPTPDVEQDETDAEEVPAPGPDAVAPGPDGVQPNDDDADDDES